MHSLSSYFSLPLLPIKSDFHWRASRFYDNEIKWDFIAFKCEERVKGKESEREKSGNNNAMKRNLYDIRYLNAVNLKANSILL